MATTRNKYVDMEVGVDGEDEGLGYEDFDDVDPVEEQKQAAVDHAVRQRELDRLERDLVDVVAAIGSFEAEVDKDGKPTGRQRFVYAPDCVECLRYLSRCVHAWVVVRACVCSSTRLLTHILVFLASMV